MKDCAKNDHILKLRDGTWMCFMCDYTPFGDKLESCAEEDNVNIHPKSVCRTILANLDSHKRLSKSEQSAVLHALKKADIDPDRVIADLSRNTINLLMQSL